MDDDERLRGRLEAIRRWIGLAASAVLAVSAGLAGAATVGALTPLSAPPAVEHALAVAATAVAQPPRDVPGPVVVCDYWCPEWNGRDDVVAYDSPFDRTDVVQVSFNPPYAEAVGMVTQAHRRLTAAGWSVDPLVAQGDGIRHFTASREGTNLSVSAAPALDSAIPTVYLSVSRGFSAPLAVAVAAGFLVGLLAGWWVARWVLRRRRRHHGWVRVAGTVAALPVFLVAVLMVGESVLLLVLLTADGEWSPKYLLLPAFLLTAFPPLTTVAAVSAVAATALAALPPRPWETGKPLTRLAG